MCSMARSAYQVDGSWLEVVWRRALAHPSPAVCTQVSPYQHIVSSYVLHTWLHHLVSVAL